MKKRYRLSLIATVITASLLMAGCQSNSIPAVGETEAASEEATEAETEAASEESTGDETEAASEESTGDETEAASEESTDAETEAANEETTEDETEEASVADKSIKVETSADGLYSSVLQITDSPDWVTALPEAQDDSVTQLFIVSAMGENLTTASITMHERDANGKWQKIISAPGFVGKNGLCADEDHAEGMGRTPMGRYHFNKAFGIADDPGCSIPYIKVDDDTYWSGDQNEGMHYNEMVDIKDYPNLDLENSEHIVDYDYQYQYCLNFSFNEDGTPGRGSAIFLHCMGPLKPYTGGCVAVPENTMKLIMQNVREDCVAIIDTMDNLGATF